MTRPTDNAVLLSLLLASIGFEGLCWRFPSSSYTSTQYEHRPWPGYGTHLLSQTSLWSPKEFRQLEKPSHNILYGDEGSMPPTSAQSLGGGQGLPASMNIIDPDKYYDDWHRVLSGYTTHRCHPIPSNMTMCQNVGYRRMILPNYLHHEEVKEVVEQSQIWLSLVHLECHPDLRKFLCSLYAPVCVEEDQQTLIDPCQELCQEVKQRCLPKMLQFGFGWPDVVKCSRFATSNSKMCIPKSKTVRHKCSGCVSNPKFESVISGYCTADLVIRARILYVFKKNSTASSVYTVKLDRQPRVLKSVRKTRMLQHLQVTIDCECSLLETLLSHNPRRLGRWIIMGKLSDDSRFLHVEHMSHITRNNLDLRRAIRAMRHPTPQLCQLPVSKTELSRPEHGLAGSDKRDDSLQFRGFRQHDNHTRFQTLGTPEAHIRQSTAPIFSLPRTRPSTAMAARTPSQAMRRSLVRRSQYHGADFPEYHLGALHRNRAGGVVRPGRRVQGGGAKEKTRTPAGRPSVRQFRPRERSSPTRKAQVALDSEEDLFSPQHLTPWLM